MEYGGLPVDCSVFVRLCCNSLALDPQLNFTTSQPSVTGISLLTGAEHQLMNSLDLIPEWDQ